MHLPKSLSLLRRMRDARLRELGRRGPMLAGSLVVFPGHTSRYLTDKAAGKTRTLYVPLPRLKEVTAWNNHYRKARQLIAELSEIQRAMLLAEIRLGR
jgi:hypothetical protein